MHAVHLNKTNETKEEKNLKNTVSSTKIYVSGEIHPIAMREIKDDTKMSNGREKSITIYDTSGPSQIQILKSTSERACHGSVSNGF
jgi:hypothetical protein